MSVSFVVPSIGTGSCLDTYIICSQMCMSRKKYTNKQKEKLQSAYVGCGIEKEERRR